MTSDHLTPAQHDHINFDGTYSFGIDAEFDAKDTARCACRLKVRPSRGAGR